LQDLCNSINDALGGVNKLEPVIKNDFEIVIIDQTLSIPESNGIELEVYGYNPDNQISNFVKDIKFISKITPQLASMISIGATAAGTTVSEIDGTAFSKWSEGLIDRFSQKMLEPNGVIYEPIAESKDRKKYKEIFETFPFAGNDERIRINRKRGQSSFGAIFNLLKEYFKDEGIKNTRLRTVTKVVFNNSFYDIEGDMDFEEFFNQASRIDQEKKEKKIYSLNEINELTSTNYALFLLTAFGGSSKDIKVEFLKTTSNQLITGYGSSTFFTDRSTTVADLTITPKESRYLDFDSTFISQGKSAYKTYINTLNTSLYSSQGIPSNAVGFIPLSFDLTLDGISGIKIYNKLNINNKFLPSNYPESLSFIITKVNHNISNNNWDTSLVTISIPKTQPYKFNFISNQSNNENINVIGPQPNNSIPFEILDGRNNRATIPLDSLLSELDSVARPAFRKFFEILTQEYSGYKVIITSVRRTWEKSFRLKLENPSNSNPGQSRHSYGLAIDINIETTSNRVLKLNNRQAWIEEGIDKVAKNAGLTWGGNFKGYSGGDNVHFEFIPNLVNADPYNQVLTQIKVIDPTLVPPFTLEQCIRIDNLIKQGKIKLQ